MGKNDSIKVSLKKKIKQSNNPTSFMDVLIIK